MSAPSYSGKLAEDNARPAALLNLSDQTAPRSFAEALFQNRLKRRKDNEHPE
jgi:hypothetical protein